MSKPGANGLTYAQAGVDIDAGNAMVDAIKPLVRATRRPGADAEIGGFGGLFDLKAAGFTDPILVAANDGVGTKVKIAIESGLHSTIGIDLVAMCVNDLIVQGAEPLLFLDYYATGKLDPKVGIEIVRGIADGCRQAGCALIGGETAEMPGMYAEKDYDLAGFAVGAAERGALLPRADLQPGDVVFGLPSSGVHSNGYSLVRRIVALSGRIDIVHINAGVLRGGPAETIPAAEWRRIIAVNQMGAVNGVLAFVPYLKQSASGSTLIFTSSAVGLCGFPYIAPYAMTKFAIAGLAESLAGELAPAGVEVITVFPGAVRTPLVATSDLGLPSRWRDTVLRMIKRRAMPPEELARRIVKAIRTRQRTVVSLNGMGFFFALKRLSIGLYQSFLAWGTRWLMR